MRARSPRLAAAVLALVVAIPTVVVIFRGIGHGRHNSTTSAALHRNSA